MTKTENEQAGNSYVIIFALWLLVFSSSSQIMIVSPMLPQIGRQLNVAENLQGLLVSVYALAVGIFALVAGPISDRFGRRLMLLAGAGLMTAALGLHYFAFDFTSLLIFRALAGVAGGALTGATVSYVGDYFPQNERGWANGWVMSSTALGQIASVPIGTLLAAQFNFQAPFLVFAIVMAAAFCLVYWFVPQPKVERADEKLTIGSALENYWELLKRSDARAAAAVYCLMFLSIALYVVYLPIWLTATHGATPYDIAFVFAVGGAASAVTGPLAGKISDLIGRKVVVLGACLGLAALMLATTFVMREFWVAYPLIFFTMMFVAARMSPLQALISELVSGKRRGTLLSLTVSIGQLGFAVGGAVAGFAYARLGYSSNAIAGAIAVVLMALIVWQFLPEPKSDTAADKEQPAAEPISPQSETAKAVS